ncbi:hypothetical protein [Aliikangiella coralliicola]|uniref:Outer membrane protein assembly factor BamE n=1 Tax=Aliikangiella coralliicola TaxID=2592383 RepID=A0A545U4P9_9GAMM|nr:hypothetical protein [Aliikangiella coralliicola]TQV84432.1 hypothetical protein FLL46_22710 [Aliikangiella coralliicola]
MITFKSGLMTFTETKLMVQLKNRMSKKISLGLATPLMAATMIFCPLNLSAENAPIKVSEQSQQAVDKPRHGQSMEQVENAFGAPVERVAAVGEPPISRWRYDNFTVYFEHDKVIHSVAHRS